MSLIGRKGAKAYREAVDEVGADIKTASKSQMDKLLSLMTAHPDLEDKWRRRRPIRKY